MSSPRAVLLRALAYLAGGLIAVGWAFQHGVSRWEQANCSGPDDEGDCDLGVFTGFVWAGGAFVAVVVAVVVVELLLRRRRQRVASASADATR